MDWLSSACGPWKPHGRGLRTVHAPQGPLHAGFGLPVMWGRHPLPAGCGRAARRLCTAAAPRKASTAIDAAAVRVYAPSFSIVCSKCVSTGRVVPPGILPMSRRALPLTCQRNTSACCRVAPSVRPGRRSIHQSEDPTSLGRQDTLPMPAEPGSPLRFFAIIMEGSCRDRDCECREVAGTGLLRP